MTRGSLRRRLLLVSAAIATVFLGLTGLALDQAFRSSLLQAERERLLNHVHTVLAGARLEHGALAVPDALPEPRFQRPDEGLFARIRDRQGRTLWRSESAAGLDWPRAPVVAPGRLSYQRLELARGPGTSLRYGLSWQDPAEGRERFVVEVLESRRGVEAQLAGFRRALWGWLGAGAVALLLAQSLLHHWGLAPLRRAVSELNDVRQGSKKRLEGEHPEELAPLTAGINRLLEAERERSQQYKNSLADLAHSLKTPLAVLRGALEDGADGRRSADALEQIDRIDAAIRYQLGRAGRSRERLGQQTVLKPVAERLLRTVAALREPLPELSLDCPEGLRFPGPEEELQELLGNLVENAVRYCRGRIHLAASRGGAGDALTLVVEDDGPGISAGERSRVLERGERADEGHAGHGIGLAVVRELVGAYGGSLEIDAGHWGGARITIRLPLPG